MKKNVLPNYIMLLTIIISLLTTSCITPKKTNYLQNRSYRIPKYNDSIGYEDYKLIKGDRIYVRLISTDKKMNSIFNGSTQMASTSSSENADLFTYLVKDDGTVELPLIGKVSVVGKTLRESKNVIQTSLTSLLNDKFTVNVTISQRFFSVIGSQSNNKYPIIKEKMTIFQALALAGDIDDFGDRSKIKIIREVSGSPKVITFDIRSKDIINSEYYYIQPNDVIYIQDVKERFFSVTSISSAISIFFSTLSFGIFIYNVASPTTTPQN